MRVAWSVVLVASLAVSAPAAPVEDVASLLRALESPEAGSRDRAVRALAALGPGKLQDILDQAVPVLGAHVDRANENAPDTVFERMLTDLGRASAAMGAPAAPGLGRYVVEGQPHEAEIGGRALMAMGPRAQGAVPVLVQGLESEDSSARFRAMALLVRIDTPGHPALRAALRSPRAVTRDMAAIGLGKTKSATAVDPLVAALRDPDESVRRSASEALGALGPLAVPAVTALLATDASSPGDIYPLGEAAIPALAAGLERGTAAGSEKAGVTLGILAGRGSGAAMQAVVAGLGNESAVVRAACAAGLDAAARSDEPRAPEGEGLLPVLGGHLAAKDPQLRRAALDGIQVLGRRRAATLKADVERLARSDPDPAVRKRADEVARWLASPP